MKTYKNITKSIVLVLSLGLLVSACDKIDLNDVKKKVVISANKKVLIEDFTGHKCPNCPKGHEKLHKLIEAYGDTNVFGVSIHAGFYAKPKKPPFDYDFRTEAGNTYNETFQPPAYPSGLVNRKEYNSSLVHDIGVWGTIASAVVTETSPVNIKVEATSNNNTLSGNVELSFIDKLQENVKLQIFVTEDSIVKPQVTPTGEEENYVHMHVLRGAVNGTWGEDLPQASYAANDTATISFSNYALGADWKPQHLHVLAFLYNTDTKEVLQVNGTKVKP
ncbi:MAG: hypothetical protein CSB02_01135 [Bacteroidia bacterium]|nr:MAG: hypothetical protein CSB02_01135 [Bacteroidia bacterium]